MQAIQHYYDLVETVIRGLGVDPTAARGEVSGQWNMKLGSATIWIDVFQAKDKEGKLIDYGYLQMMAPVVDIPTNDTARFTRELLEINHGLYGVAFTIYGNTAYIKAIRELDGLDQSEVESMFNRVGIYADDYDDLLKAKYYPAQGARG